MGIRKSAARRGSSQGWRLMALEPRLMLAADAAALVSPAVPHETSDPQQLAGYQESHGDESTPRVLVVFDHRVPNAELLAAGVSESAEFITILSDQNAIESIGLAIASSKRPVDAIHIVCHGRDGEMLLGNDTINSSALSERRADVSGWANSMTEDADILLYGCNIAKSRTGIDFVETLARFTSADVAASSNLTGDGDQDADWVLELTVGTINCGLVFDTESRERFLHTLDVSIDASGHTGDEIFELQIDGHSVATFNVDTSSTSFLYKTDENLSADRIRVAFVNDLYQPSQGVDRNLVVDSVRVGDVVYVTDSPNTHSVGTWSSQDGIGSGFGRGNTLYANGNFGYVARQLSGSRIRIEAQGETGDEWMLVRDGEEVVAEIEVGKESNQYDFFVDRAVDVHDLSIEFTNDAYHPNDDYDRNLTVHSVEVLDLETGSALRKTPGSDDVFSSGTFLPVDGLVAGLGRGKTLHANGAFTFPKVSVNPNPTPSESGSIIRFSARGSVGGENLQLLIDDTVAFEVEVPFLGQDRVGNQVFGEYQLTTETPVDLSQLKIAFTNDGLDQFGRDRNLSVGYIYVIDQSSGELLQRSTGQHSTTFSTGSFTEGDGISPGFGRGDTLNTNGFLQFQDRSRLIINAGGTTGEEQFQVIVDGVVQAEFLESNPTNSFSLRGDTYEVDFDRPVAIEDIRIQFINNGVNDQGRDRDLNLSSVLLDGRAYDSDTVFSTGTFLPEDGLVAGTGRGITLNSNGYFQFGAVADAGLLQTNPSSRFPPIVAVQWLPPQTTQLDLGGSFTSNEEDGDIRLRLDRRGGFDGPASATFEIVPDEFFANLTGVDPTIPGAITETRLTINFEDGQRAAVLEIPIEDNALVDGGRFIIRPVESTGGLDITQLAGEIRGQINDLD